MRCRELNHIQSSAYFCPPLSVSRPRWKTNETKMHQTKILETEGIKSITVCGFFFFSFFCTSVELKGDVSRGEEQQRGLLWHQSSSVPFHGRKEEKASCEGLARRHKYSRMRYREEEEEDEARIKWLKFSIWALKSSPSRDEMQTKHPSGEKDMDDEILPLVGRDRSNPSAAWYPPSSGCFLL